MTAIIDITIVLFLALGAILGFKRGVIKSAVMFLGTILVLILAYYLKNPVSQFFYTTLPFFNLGGVFGGVKVFNILLYEAIAFLLVYLVLMSVLHIIIKVSGLIELLLKFTVILGLPSKILGAIFGFFEEYLLVFLALFFLSRISFVAPYINESNFAQKIITSSPIISNITSEYYTSFQEIYSLKEKYDTESDKEEYDKEALDILLKYQIITPDAATKLVEQKKLDAAGIEDVIEKYK